MTMESLGRAFLTGLLGVLLWNGLLLSAPNHSRLYYFNPLTNEGEDELAQVTNSNGKFVEGSGWTATAYNSYLNIEMKDYLPPEGTLEVKVKNFSPDRMEKDWQPVSIWSNNNAHFYNADQTATAYAFFKTEPRLYVDGKLYWVLWSTPFAYAEGKKPWEKYAYKYYPFAEQAYSASKTYTFKIVWTPEKNYLMIDGFEQEMPHPGSFGPVELFRNIYLGTDMRTVYHSIKNVYFTDLKIYVPESDIKFKEISHSRGLDSVSLFGGQGGTLADINLDGLDDLIVANCDINSAKMDALFMQQQDGAFLDESGLRGVMTPECSRSTGYGDFDGDGDIDLFQAVTDAPNKLYLNNGDGTFSNESSARGINSQSNNTTDVVVLDVEGDGDLDIIAVNSYGAHEFYINNGNGSFTPEDRGLSAAVGSDENRVTGIVAGDVNGDHAPDLFVARRYIPCVLLINNGFGQFTDQANSAGVAFNTKVNTPSFLDYDNDGDLDLFVTQAADNLDPDPYVLVFENDGNGQFIDRTTTIGIQGDSFGLYSGDFNNDTFQDLYLLTSNRKNPLFASRIYMNTGSKGFRLESGTGAEVVYADGRGGVVSDFDRDGWVDILGVSYGGTLGTANDEYGKDRLLKNSSADHITSDNHYLLLELLDKDEHLVTAGAKIWIYPAGSLGQSGSLIGYRDFHRGEGYKSQKSTVMHFGLGRHSRVDIRVRDSKGKISDYTSIDADQLFRAGTKLPPPVAIEPASPLTLQGTAGAELPDSLQVRVMDSDGFPVKDQPVVFMITQGQGSLNNSGLSVTVPSDRSGLARAAWTLGTDLSLPNLVSASSSFEGSSLEGSPITFSASVATGKDSLLTVVSGDEQMGARGTRLPDSIIVRVHDNYGNPHPGVKVRFAILSGGGTIEGASEKIVRTNTAGRAAVSWTLGNVDGINAHSLKAALVSTAAISHTFYASSIFGPPHDLIRISGDGQVDTVGQACPDSFKVQLVDDLGNPCIGFPVEFRVLGESGSLSGQSILTAVTNEKGFAAVQFTLGPKAAQGYYRVQARYPDLEDLVFFTASAVHDRPFILEKISGDQQAARVDHLLPNPAIVRVTDQYGNIIRNHAVVFTGQKGVQVDGQTIRTVSTDENGQASVSIRLGPAIGEQTATASSKYGAQELQGSPAVFQFYASSKPAFISLVSGEDQTGIVNQPTANPLRVMIADSLGLPVAVHDVRFIVRRGAGHFGGDNQIVVQTNEQGIASAFPTLGSDPGADNNVFEALAFGDYGQPLGGAPIIFTLSAKASMAEQIYNPDTETLQAQAETFLSTPIRALVADANGNPVPGHKVTFTVVSGGGKLSHDLTQRVITSTDADGYASVRFKLGPDIGKDAHVVQASASDGIQDLDGSPVVYKIDAPYGLVDPEQSSIQSPQQVVADGSQPAEILITLKDGKGHPVPNETVTLLATGEKNFIEQPNSPTDSKGQTLALLRSSRAESKELSVHVSSVDQLLAAKPSVLFVAGAPAKLLIDAGNNQVGTINNLLDASLRVQLLDEYDNPVINYPIAFTPNSGSGTIRNTQPVFTDSSGYARAQWILGPTVGKQYVTASAQNSVLSKLFEANVETPGDRELVIIKGNDQYAKPGELFGDSLTVRVQTEKGQPLSGIEVNFTLIRGDAQIMVNKSVTDLFGMARTALQAGTATGLISVEANIDVQTVVFNCAVADAPPSKMVHLLGDGTTQTVGETVYPLAVLITDDQNKPVANVPITFESLSEGLTIPEPQPVRSNGNGQALVHAQLGTATGQYIVRASHSQLQGSPVVFELNAVAGTPVDLIKLSGDNQSGLGNEVLSELMVVKLVDRYGNGIAGAAIHFEIASGQGEIVTGKNVTTDSTGQASAAIKLGITGPQVLRATAQALPAEPVNFTANLISNHPPVLSLPADTSILVGEVFLLDIKVSDPENKTVTLTSGSLPDGAELETVSTLRFIWTPTDRQQGTHMIEFVARDPNGGETRKRMTIRVMERNHAPTIENFAPNENPVYAGHYQELNFSVTPFDADNDVLQYSWFLDQSRLNSFTNNSLSMKTNPSFAERFTIRVDVSDGRETTSQEWQVVLVSTAVELSLFEADVESGKVFLSWQTSKQENHRGFEILRSRNQTGPYKKISEYLVETDPDKNYEWLDPEALECGPWFYKLAAVSGTGSVQTFGPVKAFVAVPDQHRLLQNYPNPFNPETRIRFELSKATDVRLAIFNLKGQLVKSLIEGRRAAGYHQVTWDGRTDKGDHAAAGLYYAVFKTIDFQQTIKLLLLK
ncbi:hypothetical protein GF406_03295 [candidate division KSB1 bacterium]|nr:hypothetical protein [candidate division KSB1 bacterium]